jgi:hypothetical protein
VSHLGEDADAFFQKGDLGTYDGGPSSLQPSALDAGLDGDELTTEITPELLERRDRLQRIVLRIVCTLGIGVLALLPFRFGLASNSSGSAEAAVRVSAPPLAEATEAPAHDVSATPLAPSEPPPSSTRGTGASVPPTERAHVVAPTKALSRHAPTKVLAVRAQTSARSPSHHTVPVPRAALRNGASPSGTHRTFAGHTPPTATFPD